MSPAITSDEAVLSAARRTLDRYGWSDTTAERIADEAGVSRVTLHRRGLTRERILAMLAEQATKRYQETMWPVLTASGSGRERLELALAVLCELAEENMALLLALDASANAAVFHDGEEEQLTRSVYTEPLERMLRDGASDGTLRQVEPIEVATVLFNLVGWTYIHLRSGHRWKADRARKSTLEIALNGVTDASAI
ncbi:MAG: TetR/AcrR family transcriptional regulator [Solirubrobacterales bacterium]